MGILSKTIDTVKDVGKGVLTTLLDPQGNTRGSIAAQKLVDEGQGYINKLEAQIAILLMNGKKLYLQEKLNKKKQNLKIQEKYFLQTIYNN